MGPSLRPRVSDSVLIEGPVSAPATGSQAALKVKTADLISSPSQRRNQVFAETGPLSLFVPAEVAGGAEYLGSL